MICDLAETYHILNYKELPPDLVATLVIGLSPDSRVKRKLRGEKLTLVESLLAIIIDDLNLILWQRSKSKKKPASFYEKLSEEEKPKEELMVFDSPEAYEEWRKSKGAK